MTRLLKYFTSQITTQVLTFMAGVLVIRSMGKREYAVYAVSIGVVAAITALAESGSNAVLLRVGSTRMVNGIAPWDIFLQAIKFRIKFGALFVAIGLIFLGFLLTANQATLIESCVVISIVIASFFPIFTNSILIIFHRLHLRTELLQYTSVFIALLRVVAIGLLLIQNLNSPVAMVVLNLLLLSFSIFALSRGLPFTYRTENKDAVLVSELRSTTLRVLPMTLMMIVGEQVFVALLSLRGGPEVVAEASALTKFGIAFLVVNSWVSDWASPRLALLRDSRAKIALWMLRILLGQIVISAAFVGGVYLFRDTLLSLLGEQYATLTEALVLFAVGSSLFYLGYSWDLLNQARGWVKGSWLFAPMVISWFLVVWFWFPIGNATDAAWVYMLLSIPMLLAQCFRSLSGSRRLPHENGRALG